MGSNFSRPRSLEDILGRPVVLNTMSQWIQETKELSKKPLLILRILKATREEVIEREAQAISEDSIEKKCFEMELSLARRYARVIARTKNRDLITLFRRYLRIAVVSKEIARWTDYPELEIAFFAGLSHDIGKLVIGLRNARALREIRNLVNKGLADRDAEKIILGFEHSELGARLLQKWGMPEALVEMARYHLVFNKVHKRHKKLAVILSLSNMMVWSFKETLQSTTPYGGCSLQVESLACDWNKIKSHLKKLNVKVSFEEWNERVNLLFESILDFEARVFSISR